MFSRGCKVFQTARFLHTCLVSQNAAKGNLAKLRKKTGFSISKCKKALEQFENDLAKSEAWLKEQAQKEGWAKATKLQGRPMSHGLVGIITEDNNASLVEVNCETDFVARNEKFQGLVQLAAATCLHQGQNTQSNKAHYDKDSLGQLATKEGKTLADMLALEVGNIGENMALRRGVFVQASADQHIGSYVHSMGEKNTKGKCSLGKYGALVTFSQSERPAEGLSLADIGRQLGQHVVGMNPSSIGSPDAEAKENKDEEMAMLHQEFLLEPLLTVSEFLMQNNVEVHDFVRYECGEELEEKQAKESQPESEKPSDADQQEASVQ